jgi:hypothetical protein
MEVDDFTSWLLQDDSNDDELVNELSAAYAVEKAVQWNAVQLSETFRQINPSRFRAGFIDSLTDRKTGTPLEGVQNYLLSELGETFNLREVEIQLQILAVALAVDNYDSTLKKWSDLESGRTLQGSITSDLLTQTAIHSVRSNGSSSDNLSERSPSFSEEEIEDASDAFSSACDQIANNVSFESSRILGFFGKPALGVRNTEKFFSFKPKRKRFGESRTKVTFGNSQKFKPLSRRRGHSHSVHTGCSSRSAKAESISSSDEEVYLSLDESQGSDKSRSPGNKHKKTVRFLDLDDKSRILSAGPAEGLFGLGRIPVLASQEPKDRVNDKTIDTRLSKSDAQEDLMSSVNYVPKRDAHNFAEQQSFLDQPSQVEHSEQPIRCSLWKSILDFRFTRPSPGDESRITVPLFSFVEKTSVRRQTGFDLPKEIHLPRILIEENFVPFFRGAEISLGSARNERLLPSVPHHSRNATTIRDGCVTHNRSIVVISNLEEVRM